MDELIPILIGVIWLIYTFYSRGQKQKKRPATFAQNRNQTEPTKKESSILEKILLGEEIETEPVYETIYDQTENRIDPDYLEIEKKQKPFLSEEISSFKGEGKSSFAPKRSSSEEEEEEIKNELFEELKEFELKKAVIYSAILDAPYIGYK
jgi:hypothetical protein